MQTVEPSRWPSLDLGPPAHTVRTTGIPTTELLDFEERWPRWCGSKDEAIRARFQVAPARYLQLLHRAIDTAEAIEATPIRVRRLRRRRDAAAPEQRRRHAS